MMACSIVANPNAAANPYGPPIADFFPSDEDIPTFTNVNFMDLTTHMPTSWEWRINGSLFSIAQNPSLFFGSPGTFAILLIATNSYGTGTHTHIINVSGGGIQP